MEGSSDSAPPVTSRRISILRNFDALYVEDDAVLREDTADLLRGFFRARRGTGTQALR